jgi:F0F1-type ATP synthase delta subunit
MEKEYAQALFNLSKVPDASADELVKKLVAHLEETGRSKLLPHILREFRRIEAREASFGELLEVASESEKEAAVAEARSQGITAEATITPDLVSGWRARKGSRLLDNSGKRALIDLYRKIASNA